MGGRKNKAKKAQPNLFVRFFRIRAWKLVLSAILLIFVGATFLRFDHITMSRLKNEALLADRDGDDTALAQKLNELQRFVVSHIVFNVLDENGNQVVVFGTGPFYLKSSYDRKARAEIDKAQEYASQQNPDTNPNGNIYSAVADICDTRAKYYGWGYSQPYYDCWADELAKYPTAGTIEIVDRADIPSPSLYYRNFSSPIWYPCTSGITLLLAAFLLLVALVRALFWLVVRLFIAVVDRMPSPKSR